MKEDKTNNPEIARYMRKQRKGQHYDEDEQDEDNHFKVDFEKELKHHSKKAMGNDVEKQMEYFGHKMEPFNMKEEQEMGEIDEEGFFVFGNKRRHKDAWLDSLNDDGEQALDTMRKKIKLEQREKTVFQTDKAVHEAYNSDDENEEIQEQPEQLDQEIVDQDKLDPKDIKLLLSQLLPFSMSANKYMKQLKKQKNTELYEKILFLCNEYIAATEEHDILTLTKEDLEEYSDEEVEKPIKNWDQEEKQMEAPINNWDEEEKEEEAGNKQQSDNEDDIF